MLFKTHLALGVFVGLVCLFSFNYNPLVFAIAVFASILPDIDSTSSFIGNRFWLRPLQWIIKHRGIFHSLTACVLLAWLIALVYPRLAFSFFAGYASHLLLDSFTVEGVVPFWPFGHKTEGMIPTGGKVETGLFWILCAGSVIFIVAKLFY